MGWIRSEVRSPLEIYGEEKINKALKSLKGSFAVFAGGENITTSDGAKPIGAEVALKGKTIMLPAKCFEALNGVKVTDAVGDFEISSPEIKLSGSTGKNEVEVNGENVPLCIAPFVKNGMTFVPGEQIAKLLHFEAYTDSRLLIAGTKEAVDSMHRMEHLGVNELNEIAAYFSFRKEKNISDFSPEDTAMVKKKWIRSIVGDEFVNDVSDPDIKTKIKDLTQNARDAWSLLKKDGGRDFLFEGIRNSENYLMTLNAGKIYDMTLGYAVYGGDLYHNEDLKNDIIFAVKWIFENQYGFFEKTNWSFNGFDNWWNWDIGTPGKIFPVLMIMEDYFTTEEIQSFLGYFDSRNPMPRLTGGNFCEISKCVIASALLQNDYKRVLDVQARLESMYLYVDDNERIVESGLYGEERKKNTPMKGAGFFTDGSYILHTLHAMNGTYGPTHFKSLCLFENLFYGTAFEINTPCRYNLPWVFENVFASVIYGTTVYRHVLGRHENPNNFSLGVSLLTNAFAVADKFPDEDRDRIYSIVKKAYEVNSGKDFFGELNIEDVLKFKAVMNDESVKPLDDLSKNQVFYNMDKIVHKRNNWSVGISMSSSRFFNYECINSNNMKGWYLGDGRTEYYLFGKTTNACSDYWETLDPYRFPGVTLDTQKRPEVTIHQGNEYLSSKHFVGGATLGTYGTGAMELESYHADEPFGYDGGFYGGLAPAHKCDLVAKKSYFMFDDEVVCLGAGINAKDNNNAEVLTVADNLMINPDFEFDADGKKLSLSTAAADISGISFANAGDVCGYVFPMHNGNNPGRLNFCITDASKPHFELWFSHGINPMDSSYAYVLLPGMSKERTKKYAGNCPVKILENTPDIQVVRHKNLKITSYVFWKEGSYGGISVDSPCIVMIKESDIFEISVSDPTQKLDSLKIEINKKLTPEAGDECINAYSENEKTVINCFMANSCGRSMNFIFNF